MLDADDVLQQTCCNRRRVATDDVLRQFEKHEKIYSEGDVAEKLYIVAEGDIEMSARCAPTSAPGLGLRRTPARGLGRGYPRGANRSPLLSDSMHRSFVGVCIVSMHVCLSVCLWIV